MGAEQPAGYLAWRLHKTNWLVIAACAATFLLCLCVTDFSVALRSLVRPLLTASAFVAVAQCYARLSRRDAFGHYAFASTAQIALAASLMPLLNYVAAASALPMQDHNLARLDTILGLDWPAYFQFVYHRPEMIALGSLSYAMILWPPLLAPFILAANGEHLRLQQLTFACIAVLLLTIGISVIVPALGTFQQYKIDYDPSVFIPAGYTEQLRDLPQIRSGALRELDLRKLAGIAAFPGFHAAAAVLFVWGFWPVWWMRPVVLITNGLMLLATPLFGGHYFVDVFAGLAVALVGIAAAERVTRRLAAPAAAPSAAAFAAETA